MISFRSKMILIRLTQIWNETLLRRTVFILSLMTCDYGICMKFVPMRRHCFFLHPAGSSTFNCSIVFTRTFILKVNYHKFISIFFLLFINLFIFLLLKIS